MSFPSSSASSPLQTHLNHLLSTRQPPKTFCPSEVARALSVEELRALGLESWRDAMPDVRRFAFELRARGECEVLQKGEVVVGDEEDVRGPIRVRRIECDHGDKDGGA